MLLSSWCRIGVYQHLVCMLWGFCCLGLCYCRRPGAEQLSVPRQSAVYCCNFCMFLHMYLCSQFYFAQCSGRLAQFCLFLELSPSLPPRPLLLLSLFTGILLFISIVIIIFYVLLLLLSLLLLLLFFPLTSWFSVLGACSGAWCDGQGSWLGYGYGRLLTCSYYLGLGLAVPDPGSWAPNLHV